MLPQMIQQQFQHMKRRIRKWQNFRQLLVRLKKMTISIITKMHPEKQIKRPGGRKIRTGSMYIMLAQRDM